MAKLPNVERLQKVINATSNPKMIANMLLQLAEEWKSKEDAA